MDTAAQNFLNSPSTTRTLLAPARINFKHFSPGSFGLGFKCCDELVPSSVTDCAGLDRRLLEIYSADPLPFPQTYDDFRHFVIDRFLNILKKILGFDVLAFSGTPGRVETEFFESVELLPSQNKKNGQ